ncbi:bifunctional diaminohydroxyphosphoribosylaminopyrimidine deaminase/5-amino-6-(5-phosphoribosylamino)uracil reductase RibD [Gluconobacter kanchanaburiensis]|uniref:Riboflavin biosynthesis protein RibD n=1 Tax=Gluconobacter kanchanaburiensis NBRC 103587 TaxID=1307948 RepID=A0A511B570_9PROT|nr:bifunctional diaminohydroxyphosphoribosylaminopyrimidine deaminase/5-amino-6-(5-phosphoribosylamino)uracil reductase RibD [Gluconobacter kanchanaburiensis]MBF0861874.1 bifunctional diaminohydroxyphosphoribosylaminopyrimidine deaminase/5-amino-6-(5-phosphoribosylamino)uracil reductase RibD [Gluconobacter kanchanaburiensis]GBR67890.1 riboflavin biosynthesis protein RibD [Gluconobacter kanchanaburiensis NBRC 103587]GEK95600.1 bifunctional diaminohydroxyphosphoribosylaminopyrimidine deaminase/5-a
MPDQTTLSDTIAPSAIRNGFRATISQAVETFGATAPNPSVGCALLDAEGRILTIGAHPRTGQPHAEAMALAQARTAGVLDQARVALVTLEPCNHTGRTPPCSEALRNSPVQEVWIGAADPNPQASGGAARLREEPSAKRVIMLADRPEMADLARDCQALLAPFASRVVRHRPWISVKQALDEHGSMVPPPGQKTFTSPDSLVLAHRLRRATDAIITGIGTVLADRPRFTVRHVPDHEDRKPRLLVVCDRHGRLPADWTAEMTQAGFDVISSHDLLSVPAMLAERGVNWAMVEAGPALLASVSEAGLWDDWLTIHKTAGADRIDLKSRDESPLRLLRENACSLES